MKQILLLFMLLGATGIKAQNWNAVGGIGLGAFKNERLGNIYLDKKMYFDVNAGVRYNLGMFYLQTGLNYTYFSNNIDKNLLVIESGELDIKTNKQAYLGIPLICGFNYKVENKIYPFVQIGAVFNYAMQKYLIEGGLNRAKEKRIVVSFLGKLGFGINISHKITLEPAFVFQKTTKTGENSRAQLVGGQISVLYKL